MALRAEAIETTTRKCVSLGWEEIMAEESVEEQLALDMAEEEAAETDPEMSEVTITAEEDKLDDKEQPILAMAIEMDTDLLEEQLPEAKVELEAEVSIISAFIHENSSNCN